MKKKISELIQAVSDGLLPSEMAKAAGLAVTRLHAWNKRDLLPADFNATGRGMRRRYSWREVVTLAAIRTLADAGIQIEDAVVLGQRFGLSFALWDLLVGQRTLKEAVISFEDKAFREGHGSFVLILRRPKGWKPDDDGAYVSPNYVAVTSSDTDTLKALANWIRDLEVQALVLIDVVAVLIELYDHLSDIVEAREQKSSS